MTIWPDEKLEREMLDDIAIIERYSSSGSVDRNVVCHVKALLLRVRDLEIELAKAQKNTLSLSDWIALQFPAQETHGK